jgi:hypothetical protein
MYVSLYTEEERAKGTKGYKRVRSNEEEGGTL